MPKFKYIGDPNDGFSGPQITEQFGYEWTKGEVSDDLPEKTDEEKDVVKKLRGHSHFVDMSEKGADSAMQQRQKDLEKNALDKEKREEAQVKQDEKDAEQMAKNREKDLERGGLRADNAPRPPGRVTTPPPTDAFQGRTVEERTQAEDHTKAGKTKG